MSHRSRLLSAVLALFSTASAFAGDPPNVVIVFIDETGTDFLEMYDEVNPYQRDLPYDPTTTGSGDIPANGSGTSNLYIDSPNMDALAADGIKFTNAYAQPMCSPSRASLFSGNYATRTGVGDIFRWPLPLYYGAVTDFGDVDFDQATMPELMGSEGYTSGLFGKWHLSMPRADMHYTGADCFMGWEAIPERMGFDEWACVFNGLDNPPLPPDELVETAEYEAPVVWNTWTRFCASFEAIDAKLGDFLAGLDPDRFDNTLFIVMGDNGTKVAA